MLVSLKQFLFKHYGNLSLLWCFHTVSYTITASQKDAMEEVTCWDWLLLGEEENFAVNFMSQLALRFAVILKKKNRQYDW